MGDARERAGRSRGAGRPVFDLVASKLLRPLMRPGSVRRSLLIERLTRGDPHAVVSVVAPRVTARPRCCRSGPSAAARPSRGCRSTRLTTIPRVMLTYVAEALDAVERQELVNAQRLRPELTYALPHLAVQARIELTRVHVALADLAGTKTLMREADELLRRRPGLGTLVGQARALRTQLS